MSAYEPVSDEEEDEEAILVNKLTLNNQAKGFWLFKTALDSSMIWALTLEQMVEEGLVLDKNIFKELKKQKVRNYNAFP